MKRIILLSLLICPLLLGAQRFNGGIIAGGLVSQIDGDNYGGYNKFGYLAGGYVALKLSPHSSFQLEMEYIQKGARVNADTVTNQGNTSLTRIHYLEIPILYQYTFLKRLQAEIGPAADVLLGTYIESNGQEVPYVTVPYRGVTLSGILGVSGYITDHLKATFRFNYSLLSIRTDVVAGARKILFEVGQYNNVLSLSLSWDFKVNDF